MALSNCPKKVLDDYRGKTFFGRIVSKHSCDGRFVYIIDSREVDKLRKISEVEFNENYPILMPGYCYLYRHNNSINRVFCAKSNPSAMNEKRLYLLDKGQFIYVLLDPKRVNDLPEDLLFEPLAMFCKINSFPDKYKNSLDFIEKNFLKQLKFHVKSIELQKNKYDLYEKCLIVNVELLNTTKTDEPDKVQPTKSVMFELNNVNQFTIELTYIEDENNVKKHVPFMADRLIKNVLKPNKKILIYPEAIPNANVIYGRCKLVEKCHKDNKKLTNLMINMNGSGLFYQPINSIPIANEMLIIQDLFKNYKNARYYRGMVLETFENISMMFYVDYGYVKPIHHEKLYKFPIQFGNLPFFASKIYASNVNSDSDSNVLRFVEQEMKPFGIALIDNVEGYIITAKIFSHKGISMYDVLEGNCPFHKIRKFTPEEIKEIINNDEKATCDDDEEEIIKTTLNE